MSARTRRTPWEARTSFSTNGDGFFQKLSKTLYPYQYELVEEQEYLFFPAYTSDGSGYIKEADKGFYDYDRQEHNQKRGPLHP